MMSIDRIPNNKKHNKNLKELLSLMHFVKFHHRIYLKVIQVEPEVEDNKICRIDHNDGLVLQFFFFCGSVNFFKVNVECKSTFNDYRMMLFPVYVFDMCSVIVYMPIPDFFVYIFWDLIYVYET